MVDMMKMMKQAQAMQKNMEKLQNELAEREYEAASGGGMVKVIAKGDMSVTGITIDPQVVDPEDIEMLQDMVASAVNAALTTARESAAEEMKKVTGGIKLPGM